MKVCLFLSEDRIYKPNLLRTLLCAKREEIVAVYETANSRKCVRGWKDRYRKIRKQTAFWGMRGTYVLALRTFQISAKNIFDGTNRDIRTVANEFNVEYRYLRDVGDPVFIKSLKSLSPDLLISFQHQIFSKDLIDVPRLGALNCHPALLPSYRGVKPIFWAMLAGESELGVTVHTMTEKIDVGRIVVQKKFENKKNSTLLDNYEEAYRRSAVAIIEAIEMMGKCDLSSLPLIPQTSSYYRWPKNNDIRAFRKKGLRMV